MPKTEADYPLDAVTVSALFRLAFSYRDQAQACHQAKAPLAACIKRRGTEITQEELQTLYATCHAIYGFLSDKIRQKYPHVAIFQQNP
jgi:hypothetical protein